VTPPSVPALPGIVVDPGWLVAHHDAVARGAVVVADVRWYLDGRSGAAAFTAGHLPGARFVDLDRDLSMAGPHPATDGRHPLPSPAAFAAAMSRLGIGDATPVVAYDDSGGGTAGRLVWMLDALGHPAALLDGGLAAWPGALETGPAPQPSGVPFTARPWPPDRFATVEEVAAVAARAAAGDDRPGAAPEGPVLLDARAPERYRGEAEPVDARPGHIPGARNAPWSAVLDPATGRLRTPDDLAAHFERLGAGAGVDVVCSCGSGVSACADLVARAHAGLGRGRLFVASWSGWAADPARTAARGSDPAGG
jgi:thiosulfate/3-mercaptopyruvate sulfurtransferase